MPGRYIYYSENKEILPDHGMLELKCDKTFYDRDTISLRKDSSVVFTYGGSWKIKNDTILILSIRFDEATSEKLDKTRMIKYFIRNDQLHIKPLTKRQDRRQNKKDAKHIHLCVPGFEDYAAYKAKEDKRYYLKVHAVNCK